MKIFQQETNQSCGIACLRSILNYYEKNFSEQDLWKIHKSLNLGEGKIVNSVLDFGVTALKLGFKVKYIGYNPAIANNNSFRDLKKSLKKKSKTYFGFGKHCVESGIEFLELGGKLKIEKLNVEKLKKLLDKKEFLFVNIKPAFLGKNISSGMNHKIILEGYTKKGFKILNPSGALKEIISFDDFLLAFYGASPEALIIKK